MDAPQSCLWRPVVVYTTWTFRLLSLIGKHFRHRFPVLPSPRVRYAEGIKADIVCGKAKASAQEEFPQGNQICEVDPNEPPPLILHPFLQMPEMFICLIPNYGSTSTACLPSLLTKRLEILKNKGEKNSGRKCFVYPIVLAPD